MLRMESILFLIILLACAAYGQDKGILSTSKDGSFQAIAQSPHSIALYWRHGGQSEDVYQNDTLIGKFQPNTGCMFASILVSNLQPNTHYVFKLGKAGPEIAEKTWGEIPAQDRYDLLIIGGTASGTAAAVTAARLGMRVALVESTNRLGGMASNGLGATDIRNISRANGFFEDFRRGVVDFYGEGNGLKYEPRVANAIMKSMVYEHCNIFTFLKASAVRPIMEGHRVVGAVVRDDISGGTGRLFAATTIDATYAADFAAASGAKYRVGREPRTPEEPHAGVIYFDDATQTILPGSTGAGDNKQQSYAYLMTWQDYGDAAAPQIPQPRFYDPATYRPSPEWPKTWNVTSGKLPNGEYEINQHPFGIDWPEINNDYPTASPERRRQIDDMYKDRALGYLYFFQNERGHKNLGLASDEYLDNCNFPMSLYVREARRIEGEHMLSEAEVTRAREYHRANSVGVGDYPMDSHAMEMLTDPTRKDKGEGEEWLAKFTPWYQIPHGVVVPKNVDGLLVTTAVSGTHVGYGTLRMEPVRMSLGQAAAAMAYWSCIYSIQPRRVNPSWVQDKILSQYSYINWNSDVDRDTRHFKAINFLGARGVFANEAFEPGAPISREDTLVVLNRMLALEKYPRGMEKSPLPSPQSPITRGDFALWLVEAKQKTSLDWSWVCPETPSYLDVPKDSPYYAAVETLRRHRITSMLWENAERGLFRPDAAINRADAAEAIFLAHRAYAMNYWMP